MEESKYPTREGEECEKKLLRNLDGMALIERFEADCETLLSLYPEQCRKKLIDGLKPEYEIESEST
ncbi:MAG: hypothetical protein ABEJ65_06245 [bacterium]